MDQITCCKPCLQVEKESSASNYCCICEQHLCKDCTESHKRSEATQEHELTAEDQARFTNSSDASEIDPVSLCDPCLQLNKEAKALNNHQTCEEYLCEDCSTSHKTQKATTQHQLISAENAKKSTIPTETSETDPVSLCDPCLQLNKEAKALNNCQSCEEYLCEECSTSHKTRKATEKHKLISAENAKKSTIPTETPETDPVSLCDPCLQLNKEAKALNNCQTCEEYLCEDCSTSHKTRKATKEHKLISAENAKKSSASKEVLPGKPEAHKILPDSVTLTWEPTNKLGPEDYYQLSFKDISKDGKWRPLPAEYTDSKATLTDLKSKATFVFRVRVIYKDGQESPYSEESEQVQTKASLATKLLKCSTKQGKTDASPAKYLLPLNEVKSSRNAVSKTKKFEIGRRKEIEGSCKTILLVGATGTGKSTFVDGIINYVLGVTWDDPFRFTIVDLEDEEKERVKNQAISQTEWITCYIIYPEDGSRLDYTLQIIDTPGFGDTRGLKRDQEIVSQIRQLFSVPGTKGVDSIEAVCFLIKAPDARLTPVQNYIFQSIMSLFGNDIEENICSLITFSDGNNPPVLAAINESGLPFGDFFTFNNSGLFAENVNFKAGCLSPMFWEMGIRSFQHFFIHLNQLPRKSLQLTKDVLNERFRLEAVVSNLQENLDVGLNMVNILKQERVVLETHKSQIEANKNFVYEVEESKQIKTLIPGGVHNTKCRDCFFKCHPNCIYKDDEDKAECSVMDSNGNCTVCPEKCHWRKHFNDAYKYEHYTERVQKTYAQMQQKYKEASGKMLTHKQIVEKNEGELKELNNNIEDMMFLVKHCNEKLKEIALRPNPLSMTEHIDIMIENEKLTKAEGFQQRITILNEFRKAAEIGKHFEMFSKEAKVTLGEKVQNDRPLDVKSVMKRMASWLMKRIPGFSF